MIAVAVIRSVEEIEESLHVNRKRPRWHKGSDAGQRNFSGVFCIVTRSEPGAYTVSALVWAFEPTGSLVVHLTRAGRVHNEQIYGRARSLWRVLKPGRSGGTLKQFPIGFADGHLQRLLRLALYNLYQLHCLPKCRVRHLTI